MEGFVNASLPGCRVLVHGDGGRPRRPSHNQTSTCPHSSQGLAFLAYHHVIFKGILFFFTSKKTCTAAVVLDKQCLWRCQWCVLWVKTINVQIRGGALTYLKVVGNVLGIDPIFGSFSYPIESLFMRSSIFVVPSLCRKSRFVFIIWLKHFSI